METEEPIDKLWIIEAEKRVKDILDGKANLIPGEQVLANLLQRLKD